MAALHHLTSLGLSHLATSRATLRGSERKEWVKQWLIFLHGCKSRGDRTPGAWCIGDSDFGRLMALVPESEAQSKVFYDRLAKVKVNIPEIGVEAETSDDSHEE